MIDPFKFDCWRRSVCGCRRLFIPHRIDEQTWAGPGPKIVRRFPHRSGWIRYVYLKTAVNRATVEQTDDFIAHVQTRLEQAKRRS